MVQITPQMIETRLYDLSKELDEAHKELVDEELILVQTTQAYEVAMARSRMGNSHPDMKMTTQMREDFATIENEQLAMQAGIAEAKVKALRANVARIKTQVDIARSISASIKATLEL
jgi:hypothetical protein